MRLGTLTLEGLTRFRRPVEVDFEAIGPGVIAIAGPNGAGKTTLLEATGPGILFRELPTRTPSGIQHWIRKRGAVVGLTFRTGTARFDARVEVTRKGKQTAYLDRGGVAIASGKVSDYDDAIARLFGTSGAFYVSVFGAQGGGGRFSTLKVSDRKGLFRFYLGLDRVERAHTAARSKLTALGSQAEEIDRLDVSLRETDVGLKEIKDGRPDLDREVRDCAVVVDEALTRRDEVAGIVAVAAVADAYDRALDGIVDAEDALEALEAGKPDGPEGERPDPRAAEKTLDEGQATKTTVDMLREDLAQRRRETATALNERNNRRGAADLIDEVPCGARDDCADCQFLVDAVAGRVELPEWEGKVEEARGEEAEADRLVDKAPALPDLDGLRLKVRTIRNAERVWGDLAVAHEGWRTQITAARKLVADRKAEAKRLRAELPSGLPEDPPDEDDVEALDKKVEEAQEALDEARKAVAVSDGREEGLRADRARYAGRKKKLAKEAEDLPALRALVKALGPDGIQAFEIDAAGPRVSELATALLHSCYGTRFRVEVRTTRELRSREGVAEDFAITVVDAMRGGERTVAGLSGGEQVIIDEAIRSALALFAAERGAATWETCWRDEVVGGLDPDNSALYVRMLHRLRELGGYHQILYVTHDERAITAADAVLRVEAGGDVRVER